MSRQPISDSLSFTGTQKLLAWATHLLTASGAVWGLLTLIEITEGDWSSAFIWMAIAAVIDAFDGFMARATQVKRVIPGIDGALLDNIVDYLNYVFVPAYFIYAAALTPPGTLFVTATLVLLVSAYQFSQVDAKTEDHYFKGFPSYWNFIVFYMLILDTSRWFNIGALVFFSIMVFVPIKYVYPSRTAHLQWLTMPLAILWGVINIIILLQYPEQASWLAWASFFFVVYYYGLSFYAMIPRRNDAA